MDFDDKGLLSIYQAAAQGIDRVRLPVWANPFDHFRIDILDGKPGPFLHLYAPANAMCSGEDPVKIMWLMGVHKVDVTVPAFEPYTGPLPDSPEYQAELARFVEVD